MRLSRRAALGGLAAATAAAPAVAQAPTVAFNHGVASGDPLADRVILWTRVTPATDGPVTVRWVVARDAGLKQIVRRGTTRTDAGRDYTVKVDADRLPAGQKLHYGFFVGEAASPVGRTMTAPAGRLDRLVAASCSCSNHPAGYFNAYRALADLDELDVVIHLGDYIYEYGPGGYATEWGARNGRTPIPPKEIVTLADYRARHAQYKSDPDLQAAHARAPWIVTWDDHETTNDSWVNGAENHDPDKGEGDWKTRERAAVQAYYEWMPIREPSPGQPFAAINRTFRFGDLLTLTMLETRLLARDQQLDYARDLSFAPFDVSSGRPTPITDAARLAAIDPKAPPPGVMMLPDIADFRAKKLAAPGRTLLGSAQESWARAQLEDSVKAGVRWQAIGNQVMMARVNAPDMASLLPADAKAKIAKAFPSFAQFIELSRFGLPLNLDAWDGYPEARDRFYAAAKAAGARLVVFTGDIHSNWACELTTDNGATRLGVEIVATSITSPGLGDLAQGAGLPPDALTRLLIDANREVIWHDESARGFVVTTFTRDAVIARFREVDTVFDRRFNVREAAALSVERTETGIGPFRPL